MVALEKPRAREGVARGRPATPSLTGLAILKRAATALATLLAVSVLLYAGLAVIPGDAVQVSLGQDASPERVAILREQYGLDRPVWELYLEWLSGVVRGDLGSSVLTGRPISTTLAPYLINSMVLAGIAIAVMVPLAVLLGVVSAVRRNSWLDLTLSSSALAWASIPEFVAGTILILIFTNLLGLLPATSLLNSSIPLWEQLPALTLPVTTLIVIAVAQCSRMIRAAMIDILSSDFVHAATLRGIPRWRIVWRHAVPSALNSIIAIVVLTAGWLVGGVVVTETLFQYPGLGIAMTNAVASRDTPTVLAGAMVITAVLVVGNLLADSVAVVLDPRLRASNRRQAASTPRTKEA
ncbi:ABC transporter permease [Microbacterium atlanticum]|uniref:ABC transporter permease n=1 Tax=Microbacterium atlanticum TaxID=2782168 RepID=UPI00188913F0|nr:ABC transporter permease [Microbacterium atlanticum]